MKRRLSPLALALLLTVGVAAAQDSRLPDMGSSAGTLLSPAQQDQYGAMVLAQLRHAGYVLDDPLLDDWLDDVGQRLGAASAKPQQHYTFFLLKVREINAFATLGGYVAVNAGLVLAADTEDEVAGVLAHEISHVTQEHVLRGAEKAQRESIPILLATLGAIIAAQQSGGSTNRGDATSAAIMTGLGMLQQRQITYTRDNEAEADRIGIRTLARAGYRPEAMADFFQTLQAWVQMNQGDVRGQVPDYLQTHPLTLTRISEARQRAAKLESQPASFTALTPAPNPLLPPGLQLAPVPPAAATRPDGVRFGYARERMRVLSAATAMQAIREYQQMQATKPLDDARRYGLAVARQQAGQTPQALQELQPLLQAHPDNLWIQVTAAELESASGRTAEADRRFETLLARMPTRAAVALSYARVLADRATPAAGTRAVAVLRPLLASNADNPLFQQAYARANEIAGDPVRAGEAWAEVAWLGGRPEQALVQLNNLKKRPDLDYYARSRIDARIAVLTPIVMELRRQGIRDEEVTGGRLSFGVQAH